MRLSKLAITLMALMLGLSACGGTTETKPTESAKPTEASASEKPAEEAKETEEPAAPAGDLVASIKIGEPKSLIPQKTTESEGAQVLNALFSPLVQFDDKILPVFGDKAPNAVAADITNNADNTLFTIKLKEGWTFHNGDPVDAQSYVDAWNWAVNPANAADTAYFFENIAGYQEVVDKKAETMSGVKVVDPLTIEVTMANAFSPFIGALGYNAFYPVPKAFFDDVEKYNAAPIGNGPFMMDGEWVHDEHIQMKAFDKFAGGEKPKVAGLEYRIYTDPGTAYNDVLAGNLDVTGIPNENLGTYKDELDGRFYVGPSSTFTYVGIAAKSGKLAEDKRLRQALSMAIDRQTIADTIFEGALKPADDFVSPLVAGYRKDACKYCHYDPDAAKKLWDEAGGLKDTLNIWFNAGAGHEKWMEAVTNGWGKTLGLPLPKFESMQFAEYLKKLDAKEVDGPYRLGWSMDYPSSQNYLSIWTKSSSSNYSMYANDAFDKLLVEGNAAPSLDEAIAKYNAADDMILEDMPGFPMFFGTNYHAHSDKVKNLKLDPFSHYDVVALEAAS